MRHNIVFHYPRPIIEHGTAGGTVRPYQMLQAFRRLGYNVDVVAGYSAERNEAIRKIARKIEKEDHYEFAYSETMNMPVLLGERRRLAGSKWKNVAFFRWLLRNDPSLDFGFLGWIKKNHIPTGLFCRDVLWRFEQDRDDSNWKQRALVIPLYKYDWRQYENLISHLFLPDLAMIDLIPGDWKPERISALPPGCIQHTVARNSDEGNKSGTLNLFYVGGVSPPTYDLKPGIDAINSVVNVHLTICCREDEWERMRTYYEPLNSNKVSIVHKKGKDLVPLYNAADIFYLVRSPYEYYKYTISIKVVETLGFTLPIVTMDGTVNARFIHEEGTGWLASTQADLVHLLTYLASNPGEIFKKREHLLSIRERHTWDVRAQNAVDFLSRLDV